MSKRTFETLGRALAQTQIDLDDARQTVGDARMRLAACSKLRETWQEAASVRAKRVSRLEHELAEAREIAAKLRSQLERPGGSWDLFPWERGVGPTPPGGE